MGGVGAVVGARYMPPSILPQVGPEHPGPATDHSTAVFVVPETVAASRSEYPGASRAFVWGEMLTFISLCDLPDSSGRANGARDDASRKLAQGSEASVDFVTFCDRPVATTIKTIMRLQVTVLRLFAIGPKYPPMS
jgi:hypothetical protein